jgi:Flp pilus assembly protein TadG
MRARHQSGTTTVEFAIVGAVTLTLIFVVIEFSRILFSLNVLNEGVRRATRVAAVCAVGDAAIADAAVFVNLPRLTTGNVVTEYLGEDGAPLGDPAAADYPAIRYVRVRIANYGFPVALPFIATWFAAPQIVSTLPRESLGVPKFGAAPAC